MGFIRRAFGFVALPSHTRTLGLVLMLVLVAAVSLTVYVAQQQQDLSQRAEGQACGDEICNTGFHCVINNAEPPFCEKDPTQSCSQQCLLNEQGDIDQACFVKCTQSLPTPTPLSLTPTFTPTPTPNCAQKCTNQQTKGFDLTCYNQCTLALTPTLGPTSTPTPTLTPTPIPCGANTCDPGQSCIEDTDKVLVCVDNPTPTLAPTSAPAAVVSLKDKGDADGNGLINEADYEIWKTEFINKAGTRADFNTSGAPVDIFDFNIWYQFR